MKQLLCSITKGSKNGCSFAGILQSSLNEETTWKHLFLSYSSARIFFISFVLHAFFSFDKRLQEIFFQNHPPLPLSKVVKMVGP